MAKVEVVVNLTEEQYQWVSKQSKGLGISKADVICKVLDVAIKHL